MVLDNDYLYTLDVNAIFANQLIFVAARKKEITSYSQMIRMNIPFSRRLLVTDEYFLYQEPM
jgi:hypothetical protein